jgi:hypothetical protein
MAQIVPTRKTFPVSPFGQERLAMLTSLLFSDATG